MFTSDQRGYRGATWQHVQMRVLLTQAAMLPPQPPQLVLLVAGQFVTPLALIAASLVELQPEGLVRQALVAGHLACSLACSFPFVQASRSASAQNSAGEGAFCLGMETPPSGPSPHMYICPPNRLLPVFDHAYVLTR